MLQLKLDSVLRVPTPNSHPKFIEGMYSLVSQHLDSNEICSQQMKTRCPLCINPSCAVTRHWIKTISEQWIFIIERWRKKSNLIVGTSPNLRYQISGHGFHIISKCSLKILTQNDFIWVRLRLYYFSTPTFSMEGDSYEVHYFFPYPYCERCYFKLLPRYIELSEMAKWNLITCG